MINGDVSLKIGSTTMPDVGLTFGMAFPKQRRRSLREGWGFAIELPAVLDILMAVENGDLSAGQARDLLLKIPLVVYDDWALRTSEDPKDLFAWCVRDGGCADCTQRQAAFDTALDSWEQQFLRFQRPEAFPFAVGNAKGLHESTCPVARRGLPSEWSRPAGADYQRVLRIYAHHDDYRDYQKPPLDELAQLDLQAIQVTWSAMTAEEARAWMAEHTGPKGGRHYHRCRRCSATP
jgi:hypothetical protein